MGAPSLFVGGAFPGPPASRKGGFRSGTLGLRPSTQSPSRPWPATPGPFLPHGACPSPVRVQALPFRPRAPAPGPSPRPAARRAGDVSRPRPRRSRLRPRRSWCGRCVNGQWDLPTGGQQNCPLAANRTAHRRPTVLPGGGHQGCLWFSWSVASPPFRRWLG